MHIKAVQRQTCRGYGCPRIWRELRNNGVRVGKHRLHTLMQKHGIRAKGKKRFKVTTDSNHDLPIAANLLNRQFAVAAPDKVWVASHSSCFPPTRPRAMGLSGRDHQSATRRWL